MLIKHALQYAGGSAPPGVVLPAVSFGPSSYLKSTKLGTTDTPYGIYAFWSHHWCGTTAYPAGDNSSVYVRDLFMNDTGIPSEQSPGVNLVVDNAGGAPGTLRLNFNDATTGANHQILAESNNGFDQAQNGTWNHYIVAWDFSTPATPVVVLCVNGVQQTVGLGGTTITSALSPNIMNNASGFALGGSIASDNQIQDMAQFLMDTTQSYIVSGAINPAVLSKLYNNGAVDFGANGATPLGKQPQVYHNGDYTSFATEQGTCGATWSMVLSNIGGQVIPLQKPASTPGSAHSAPYLKWLASHGANGIECDPAWFGETTSSSTTFSVANGGNPIQTGDLVVLAVQMSETSNPALLRSITPVNAGGWAWTPLAGSPMEFVAGDTNWSNQYVGYCFAPSNVAAGSDLVVQFNYLTDGTHGAPMLHAVMLDYGDVTTVAAAAQTGTAAFSTLSAPSMTPTSAVSTLVNMYFEYAVNNGPTYTFPGTSNIRMLRPAFDTGTGKKPNLIILDEVLTGTSPSGVRSIIRTSASAPAVSLLLQ